MIDPATLLLFVTASVILTLAPGPDILFLITQGVSKGPRAGFATAMGLSTGCLVHTTAAAFGASVIFRTSALAFHALQTAGVLYLLYLAWKTFAEKPSETSVPNAKPPAVKALYARGFLMNILNPKVALFFLAFLPQFAAPERGPVWLQMVFYGVVFTAQVVIVFGSIGLFAGAVSEWMSRGRLGRARRHMKWAVACVYLTLAIRLVFVES